MPPKFDFRFLAKGTLQEGYPQIISEIGSLPGTRTGAAAWTETKEVAKDIAKTGENILEPRETAKPGALQTIMAEAVVQLPFFGIPQHLVSLRGFLKPFFGFCIIWVPVRVKFEGQLPVGLLDFLFAGFPAYL
jgi:hypothetical protein